MIDRLPVAHTRLYGVDTLIHTLSSVIRGGWGVDTLSDVTKGGNLSRQARQPSVLPGVQGENKHRAKCGAT